MAAENDADEIRVGSLYCGDVESELKARPPPRHPRHLLAEDLVRQPLPVGGRRDGDAAVGMEMVDVRGIDEGVHGGVDRRGGGAASMDAVIERGDHIVFVRFAAIDVDERAYAVEPERGEAGFCQGAQVTAGPLHPQQRHRLPGHRVVRLRLHRGIAARVVGVAGVGAEPVAARQQRGDFGWLPGHDASCLRGPGPGRD